MEFVYGILVAVIAIFAIYYYRRKKMLQIYNADGSLSYDISKNGLRILGVYTSSYLYGKVTIPIKTKPHEKVSVVVGSSAYSEHYGSAKVVIDSVTESTVNCTIYSTARAGQRKRTTEFGYVKIIVLGSMS